MRSCSDVHNFLLEQGVAHEIVHLPALSGTPRRAAALLGVPLHEVVKSVVFDTDHGPVVCLVPGDAHVDRARLGAMPPCGLAADLPIVADPAVFEMPVVYCGTGTTTTMLKIRSADLREALGVRVAAIAARPQNGAASRGVAV